jgi:DNA repair protein RadA/Sms
MRRMARARSGYECSQCGWQSVAYAGRCGECHAWNTLQQVFSPVRPGPGRVSRNVVSAAAETVLLADVPDSEGARMPTGIPEFDRVLGGGLVPGSLVLTGGEPGIGKSTLVLQAAARLAEAGVAVAYICGEESPRQVRMRAARLGLERAAVTLIPETNLEAALAAAEACGAAVVAIDSIQSVYVEGLESRAGGPAQLAETGARLVRWAKGNSVATIVTGHVTKGGEIAGPRLLEHLVDVVLYFENAESGALRVLRAVKNRFGATDEVGVFEMTGERLRGVENPRRLPRGGRPFGFRLYRHRFTIEGSRPLVGRIQALAVPSFLATPRASPPALTPPACTCCSRCSRRASLNAGNLDRCHGLRWPSAFATGH